MNSMTFSSSPWSSSSLKFGAINLINFGKSSIYSARFRCLCVASPCKPPSTTTTISEEEAITVGGGDIVQQVVLQRRRKNSNMSKNGSMSKKDTEAQLKENWLDSLSYSPFPSSSSWVIGVDPDNSGAIALLKPEIEDHHSTTCSVQVFDSPHVTLLIGKRSRRRLDAKSIVHLIRSFDAPVGTIAYVEQSIPFPQDGKQGWWSGGFGYGLWIGILVASGFSVVPVPSVAWKKKFCLSGSRSSKDDSRELASTLFPTMCPLLKRKKDHGRAEALLIAAYGKGMNLSTNLPGIPEDLM